MRQSKHKKDAIFAEIRGRLQWLERILPEQSPHRPEKPPVLKSAVDWCKWHLAALKWAKEESKPSRSASEKALQQREPEQNALAFALPALL